METNLRNKYNLILLVSSITIIVTLVFYQINQQSKLIRELATGEISHHINSAWENLKKRQETLKIAATLQQKISGQTSSLAQDAPMDFLRTVDDSYNYSNVIQYIYKSIKEKVTSSVMSGFVAVPCNLSTPDCNYLNDIFLIAAISKKNSNAITIAGINLTSSHAIVDEIYDTIFSQKSYLGQRIGSVTIFSGDLRAKTTILDRNNFRAVGTRVSDEVYQRVIEEGKPWIDKARVLHDDYYTRYDPIRDINGDIIGMLYIGKLKKYVDQLRTDALIRNILVTVTCIVIIFLALSWITSRILRSVDTLTNGMNNICQGQLDHQVDSHEHRELKNTIELFNKMAKTIKQNNLNITTQRNKILACNHNYMDLMNFIATDLKVKLSSSYLNIELLLDGTYGPLTEEQVNGFEIIRTDIHHIKNDIVSYLDVTNATDGQLIIERTAVNLLNDSLEPALEQMDNRFKELDIDYSISVPQDLVVAGDKNLLNIVFRNTLLNLYPYVTPEQQIMIKSLELSGMVIISITLKTYRDSTEKISKIFDTELNMEGNSALRETPVASGVGTFIIHQILKQHGGKIWIEPEAENHLSLKFTLQT